MTKGTKRSLLLLAILAICGSLFLLWRQQQTALPPASGPGSPAVVETSGAAEETLSLLFLDVGQADSILVRCGGEAMLVDGGNVGDSDTVATVLGKQGLDHLDYVVCTHAHEDHAGGVSGALHVCKVDHLLCPVQEADSRYFQNLLKEAAAQELEIEVPAADEVFTLGGTRVEVLGPREDYNETNDTSIVLKLTFGDTKFLLTGDMETAAEKDLVEAGCNLDVDLLKVGHHGSSGSTSYTFLNAVTPEYGVISCGMGNDYGHPHEETLSRLRDAGVQLYRTDLQGDILAESDGESITITTARNQGIETNPTANSAGEVPAYYIGNSSSKKFHRPDCSGLPDPERQIRFERREDAVMAGYVPCGVCKP